MLKFFNFIEKLAPDDSPLNLIIGIDSKEEAVDFAKIIKNLKELADNEVNNLDFDKETKIISFGGYYFEIPMEWEDFSWDEKIMDICEFISKKYKYDMICPVVCTEYIN